MTKITDIINIQITRETRAVSRASFSIPCFIASHTAFTERAREYADLTAVAEDFATTSKVYKAASQYFGQQVVPQRIVVGRRQINEVTGTPTVANSTVYSITINGTAYTYTSDATATALEICAGLDTAVGSPTGVNFVDNLNGTFKIISTVVGTAIAIKASSNIALVNTAATETWADTITAVRAANDSWYYVSTDDHTDAGIQAVATVIQTVDKLYGFSSADSTILTSATTDIFSVLKGLTYDHSFGLYSANADTQFPECAWIGSQAQAVPGSNTWSFKNLVGVTPDTISDTQTTYAKNKYVATYETIGGISATTRSQTCGAEYIDVMVGVSWTRSRMQEGIWFVLVNSAKVPYIQSGISQIETQVRMVIAEGIRNGLYASTPAPVIIVPDAATVDANLRATRTLDAIKFEVRLAGAIEKVIVRGTVSV